MTSIGNWAFDNCGSLTDVYCLAEDVPDTYSNAFSIYYIASAILHVPTGSVEAYKITSPWSSFGTIVGLTQDEPDILESVKESDAAKAKYFDLHGRKISKPQKGLYITAGRVVLAK